MRLVFLLGSFKNVVIERGCCIKIHTSKVIGAEGARLLRLTARPAEREHPGAEITPYSYRNNDGSLYCSLPVH